MVDTKLVRLFNRGAAAARDGRHAEALHFYRRIHRSETRDASVVDGEFLATVSMRIAYCLMDLRRYEEAVAAFGEAELFLDRLSPDALYDYHFSLANALGAMGHIEQMEQEFDRALKVAGEVLGDLDRCEQSWRSLLGLASAAQAWDCLARRAPLCLRFAEGHGRNGLTAEAQAAARRASSRN